MVKKGEKGDKGEVLNIPMQVKEALEEVAKLIGVAVGELWEIFVRQYVVRGISELFTGIVIVGVGIYLNSYIKLWTLAFIGIAMIFFYGAIQLLGNPKYYALNDIIKRIQDIKNKSKSSSDMGKYYY